VGLVEGLRAGVAQAGPNDDVVVRGDDVGLLVALVLDAQVVGQPAVTVQGARSVRQQPYGLVETNLYREHIWL
jgi:hypothetical protein